MLPITWLDKSHDAPKYYFFGKLMTICWREKHSDRVDKIFLINDSKIRLVSRT